MSWLQRRRRALGRLRWLRRRLLRHGNLLGSIGSSQSHERQTTLGADWEFAVGRSTTKVAPPPGVAATPTWPSCALTMAATIARPSPLPPPWPRPRGRQRTGPGDRGRHRERARWPGRGGSHPRWWGHLCGGSAHSKLPVSAQRCLTFVGLTRPYRPKEIPMTQQPPPQPPQPAEGTPPPLQPAQSSQSPLPPEDASQHTAPLWYEQTQTQPQYPAYPPVAPPTPTESRPAAFAQPGAKPAQSAKPRRLAEAGAIALVAAVLASAGTYAVTRNDVTTTPAAQTSASATTSSSPVLQANASAPNWSVTAAAVSPSVVAISVTSSQASGQGSGVVFDTKGHILTNNHVVAVGGAGSQIAVTLNDKRTYDATVVGTDPSTDLAVIKLTNAPTDLKAIALGDANAIKVGDQVMAVGNPLGLAGTVTTGIVSALNRPVTTSDAQTDPTQQTTSDPVVTNAIQTSAAINPGNSGGALVNL